MRVYTPKSPGYLRARAYTNYIDGAWSSDNNLITTVPGKDGLVTVPNSERLSEKVYEGVLAFKTFWYQS